MSNLPANAIQLANGLYGVETSVSTDLDADATDAARLKDPAAEDVYVDHTNFDIYTAEGIEIQRGAQLPVHADGLAAAWTKRYENSK